MERYRFFALLRGSAAICAVLTMAASSAVCQDARKPAKPNGEAQHCQTTKKDSARMPCHKEEGVRGPTQQQSIEPATWQLARTPNPAGGPDSISIMKIAEATRSDQDVTGLMLRCAEGATTEVLVVLIKPLPLRTHAPQSHCRGRCNDVSIYCKRGDARSFRAAPGESIRAGRARLAVNSGAYCGDR